VHRILHAAHPAPGDRVAQLAGPLGDGVTLPAELQHLGHERQRIEFTAFVERGQDLGVAAHLDNLADAQAEPAALHDLVSPQPLPPAGVRSK
jgi:hypothetical protein